MVLNANGARTSLAPGGGAMPLYRSSQRNSRAPSAIQRQTLDTVPEVSSYVPPHLRHGANATPSTMDQTTQRLGGLRLGARAHPCLWDASEAPRPPRPAPSMLTCHFGGGPGQVNSMATCAFNSGDKNKWRMTAVCVQSPWTRNTFNKGDVISVPYHVANMDPKRKVDDPIIRLSEVGPVLSKRRMVIVLFKFKQTMFCLPIYSFTGRGIESRNTNVVEEYVQLINVADDEAEYEGRGKYEPIQFQHVARGRPLNEFSTIHITGGKTVS